jgi:putative DNA primase/helicase
MSADITVAVTFFDNEAASTKREERTALSELARVIYVATAPAKVALRWLKLARFGERRSEKGSLRFNDNVLVCTGIEADYDAGKVAFQTVVDFLRSAGIACIVYTSPSYVAAFPKWRVICPFSEELPPGLRADMLGRLAGLLSEIGVVFAGESWTLSQSYYYGSVNGNPAHQVVHIEGTPIDLRDDLDAVRQGKPGTRPQPSLPVVAADPADISDARLDGLLRALLARLSEAQDGQKHEVLLRIARTLGGYAHLFGLGDEQLVRLMLGALPTSVEDWDSAAETARDGLAYGRAAPLALETRPLAQPHDGSAGWGSHGDSLDDVVRPSRASDEASPFDDPGYLESLLADEPTGRTILKVIKGEYVRTAEQIETIATAASLPIYSHGEALCRPVAEQRRRYDGVDVTVAVLRNYTTASLRRAVDPAIGFSKFDGRRKRFVACEPPADIIAMVLAGEQKQVFPPVRGIIGTPILRPNRTIVATPGYDAETGYYLVDPPPMPPVPAAPTRDDALAALAILADLLAEFPFVDDVSRSVAYSGLITPLVRAACDVVPGHLFTAPKQGSGKSLLVDTASAIATGERAYAILAHRQPEELDKQLTAALLEGRQIIALDNLVGEIESSVLAQVTERERISARPLGTSQTVAILNSFNTYLTGNNVTVAGDNTRRHLVSRIDPQVENPLDRRFERTNPVSRVLQDRGSYVAACLAIVLAYLAQGRPNPLPPTPSYEAWSELVREPLVWLGLPDPTDSMRAAFDDDPGNAQLAALMAAWPVGQTDWTAAELIDAALKNDAHGPVYPGLAEALKPIARDRRGMLDAVVLGNHLRLNRDKIVGGRKISRNPTSVQGGFARWVLSRRDQ